MQGKKKKNQQATISELILYQTEDGKTRIEVKLQEETVWLTQKLMAELFQTTPQNITIHLKNIFNEGELEETATSKDFLQVQLEGGRQVERKQSFYNLNRLASEAKEEALADDEEFRSIEAAIEDRKKRRRKKK